MSLKAITWVMENAPVKSPAEMVILYALADRAHDDGTAAWPSYQWIADRAVCSRRTVMRHIKEMEKRGLIRRGDQRFVAHLPADKRPTVWDLDLTLTRPKEATAGRQSDTSTGCQSVTPDRGGVSSGAERGDNSCSSGVSSGAERGDSVVTQSVLEPSVEPPKNQPPVVPQGGPAEKAGEGKAKTSDRGTRLPEDFFPSEKAIQIVRGTFPGMQSSFMTYEHQKFVDHFTAASGSRGVKKDWDATWRNWMRTAVDRLPPSQKAAMFGQGPSPQPATPQQPSKADQYRDMAADIAHEFASGGEQ